MKVRFLETRIVEAVDGPTYEAGKVYDLRPDQYHRWKRRGAVELVEVQAEPPAPAAGDDGAGHGAPETPAALIAQADEMGFFTLRSEAARFLNPVPPKKSDILDALQALADAETATDAETTAGGETGQPGE